MKPLDPALLPHLRPARRSLTLAVTGSVAAGLFTVAQGVALGTLLVRLVQQDAWHPVALWFAGFTLARALALYLVDTAAATAASQVSAALQRRLLDHAFALSPGDFARQRTGELTLLLTRGVTAVEPYLTRYLPALLTAAVLPAATVAVIWWLDWLSGLVVLLTLPLVPVFAVLIGLATRDRADWQWRQLGLLAGHFLDVVRGLPTLVAHRRAEAQAARIRVITDRYRRATVETLRVAFASSAVLELVATLSVALVAVTVGLRLASGGLPFTTAMVVLLLAPEAYWPWRRVGAEFHAAAEGAAAFTQAARLLEAPPDGAARGRVGAPGPIAVRDLTVTYPGRPRPALAGLSADFPFPGLTAVTGPSGSGKSTLLSVLLGEVTADSGSVSIADVDLASVEADSWRALVAHTRQTPWLTPESVRDNLLVARPDAGDERLWGALATVHLADVVAALPKGLDTVLGDDGAGLSAGQRARLSLARVVLADRPYVFLDEPTAHLDDATEEILLRVVSDLARRSCVVIVAHRPSVVAVADRVVSVPAAGSGGSAAGSGLRPDPETAAGSPDSRVSAAAPVTPHVAPPPGTVVRLLGRLGYRAGLWLGAGSVASGVALTATAAWLITRASEHPPVLTLMVAIVGVRLFGLARPVLRYAERVVSHDAALRLLAERRAQVYDALVPLVPGRIGRRRGDVLTSVVDDVDGLVDERLRVRQPVWTSLVVIVGVALAAGVATPVAGMVTAALGGAGALAWWVARRGAAAAEPEFVAARARLSAQTESVLDSARELVLWRSVDRALQRLASTQHDLSSAALRAARATAAARAVPLLAGGVGVLASAALIDPADVSPAVRALLVMLPVALVETIAPLADAGSLSVRTAAARDRLDRLAATPPAVRPPAQPARPPAGAAAHTVRLVEIRAGWDDRDAVRHLAFDLPAGGRVALVGPSGSGKSTVAALLLRFLDPRDGAISLGDVDLRALSLDDLRSAVGLVDDAPYLFSSTLAENVRLARPAATDEQVRDALVAARLGDWLEGLPAGLGTRLGEGAEQISGGERARIAVARVLLGGQGVLVLDEPTAHLDHDTAVALTNELLADGTGRSVLWITHGRLGLDRMDAIVALDAPVTAGSSRLIRG